MAEQAVIKELANRLAAGKDEGVVGKQKVTPVVLQGIVTWLCGGANVEPRTFFDTGVTGVSKNFTGEKYYPNGFANEFLRVTHAIIEPDVIFAALASGGNAADAFNYFAAGTLVTWKVDGVPVFDHPLEWLLPFYSVRNPSGTLTTINKTVDFEVPFPEPIDIPAGKNLTVVINPPALLVTGAAAATNPHYPGALNNATTEVCALRIRALGYKKAAA